MLIDQLAQRNNFRSEHGSFDIVGDVHGCIDELLDILHRLGHSVHTHAGNSAVQPLTGRKLAFVGDLVDRGPATPAVLRLVSRLVHQGQAFCVPGNHDAKLVKALRGQDVKLAHGIQESLDQLAIETPQFRTEMADFLDGLPSHCILDEGKLIVVHAAFRESMLGLENPEIREFALNGESTGELDQFGMPERLKWAADYKGTAFVVYGHTPHANPVWLNNTVNIDTGCVYGGKLTALRYPEMETVSVPSRREYYHSSRPFLLAR